MIPDLHNSDAEIAAWEKEGRTLARMNAGYAVGESAHLLHAHPFPMSQDQWLPAQKPVTSIALAENKPSRKFREAVASIVDSTKKAAETAESVEKIMHHGAAQSATVGAEDPVDRFMAGDPDALDEVESVKTVENRWESQRNALHIVLRKLGHSQIPHALVIRSEISAALTALVKRLEERDAEECAVFGIKPEASAPTRVAQSVRIQFARRTQDLASYAAVHPKDAMSCFAYAMFTDFIDME